MSQIQICFWYFVSSLKSGLLAVSVFRRLNWKSQTGFTLRFSKTIPRFHRSLYHTVSAPMNLCSLAQVTASIISALLCLVRYSLLHKTINPATRCSTVWTCPWHTQHRPSSISPRPAFQDLVSTICSSIDIIDDVFRWSRFWVGQRWHSSSCSLKNLLCCSLDWYVSILICLVPFWSPVFTLFHVGFYSCLIRPPSSCTSCLRISISCLLLPLLFVLESQQHFLPLLFPFSRQLGSTYFLTLTCSMPLAALFPSIHLPLILILFLHLLFLGKVSCRLPVSLAFALICVLI